jgi:hypothetical protein
MQSCVLYNSLWKNAVLALIGTSFVFGTLAGGVLVKMPWVIALFGLMALSFGYRTFDRRPRVIIDSHGISDLRNSVGLIPWSEIAEARFASGGSVDFIYVTVKSPDSWRSKLPPVYRLFWKSFQKRRVINIPLQNMTVAGAGVQICLEKWCHGNGAALSADSMFGPDA